MAAIMLCTCSGDQSKFEEMPRSPESLATRDFSANGSSRTGNREATPDDSHVNEVESDVREINYEEAFIAYRRALVRPWNLDSQRSANLQKERAVTLLYCGVEVKFPQEFNQQQNLVTPENNIEEEEILLLLVLIRKLALREIKNPAENHGPNGPNGGLEHMPNALGGLPGQVPDVLDGDVEQEDMNPAENHGPDGPNGGLEHMPNALGGLPGQVPDVLDGDVEQEDMNPAENHGPNGPNGVPNQVPNALGGVPGVLDEVQDVPDGDAAQQDMDKIAAVLPGVDCFYY